MLNAALERKRPPNQKKFAEFEIKDFLGIASSNRNPQKNECQICKNFDLREITGDLTSRLGYRRKYTAPSTTTNPLYPTNFNLTSVSWLRAINFVVDINGTEQEVTILIGKGILTDLAGVGNINIGLFFITPWYDGSSWITTSWQWLNECYLTNIDNLSNNTFRINGAFPNTADYFKDWMIYNVTKDDYHQIYDSAYVDATETTVSLACATASIAHNFENTDRVLVMRNFIPYADLQEYYNVLAKEISFHNVLSDLRIGFGGRANRLGLMIGYKNKSFQMENDAGGLLGSSVIQQISDINKIILSPYNSITEDTKAGVISTWGDQNAFHIVRLQASATNNLPDGRWFFKLTALIDNYEEFVLPAKLKENLADTDINVVGSTENYFDTLSVKMTLQFRMFWCLFNKRITKLRLYISYDSTTAATEPTLPYYLLKEWDLIGAAAVTGYDLNDYGYLYDNTGGIGSSFSFGGTQWTNLTKDGSSELAAKLNYPITDDYVRGWDHAQVVDKVCYVINPYINGERLLNYIYFSPFSGAGASQYDALQSGNYISVDSHDGNNLKGLGVFSNANLAVFKTNTLQKVRSNTAQVSDLIFGNGLDTFRSIVNHGDRLTWCSQEDILSTNGAITQNTSDRTIRNLFRAISTKTNIIATKEEKDNAYRFFDDSNTQYLLSPRGWVSIVTYFNPTDFIIAKDGTLWFMKNGLIYNFGTYYNDINAIEETQAVALQWKSIPFDISLLGEGLTQGERFWVDGVFCKYSTPADLSLKIYMDGTLHDTITLPSASTYYDTAIKYGALGSTVEIEVSGSINNANKVIVSSLGLRWRPLQAGNRV